MPHIPVRYIHLDLSPKEAYSLDSVGKHGFGKLEFTMIPFRIFASNTVTSVMFWLFCCVICIFSSHGDWSSAPRRGEVRHLHSHESWCAAHVGLGPFLQLRYSFLQVFQPSNHAENKWTAPAASADDTKSSFYLSTFVRKMCDIQSLIAIGDIIMPVPTLSHKSSWHISGIFCSLQGSSLGSALKCNSSVTVLL